VTFVLVTTRYPCCKGTARIRASPLVPREQYSRKCPRCGARFEVERRTANENPRARIDVVEWTCLRGSERLYAGQEQIG
jgi:ssDNA-binding Zn-finger/Zn-ribbon topoisomerase 1